VCPGVSVCGLVGWCRGLPMCAGGPLGCGRGAGGSGRWWLTGRSTRFWWLAPAVVARIATGPGHAERAAAAATALRVFGGLDLPFQVPRLAAAPVSHEAATGLLTTFVAGKHPDGDWPHVRNGFASILALRTAPTEPAAQPLPRHAPGAAQRTGHNWSAAGSCPAYPRRQPRPRRTYSPTWPPPNWPTPRRPLPLSWSTATSARATSCVPTTGSPA
jgi:hypothetical protein